MALQKKVVLGTFVVWMASVSSLKSAEHAMFRAIRDGNVPLLESLLREGTPVNITLDDGTTPLMVAALHGTTESVGLLLEHGADPNHANQAGVTPLIWSVGNPAKVDLLLEAGANVNARTSVGNTPLIVAAAFPGGAENVSVLLDHGADLYAKSNRDRTVLRNAVASGDVNIVRVVLNRAAQEDRLPALVQDQEAQLIIGAASNGDTAVFEELVSRIPNFDQHPRRREILGRATHRALLAQRPGLACQLIEQGADLDQTLSPDNAPSLVMASYLEDGDATVVQSLLEHHVDVTRTNRRGETALTWARRRGYPQVVELLEKAGVPVTDDAVPNVPQRNVNLHSGNQLELLQPAIRKSLRLLERASNGFLDERKQCVSCHHQNMPGVALGWARDRGFEVDSETIQRMLDRQVQSWEGDIERAYQMDRPVPVPPRFLGYGFLAFSALGYQADDVTEAFTWYLASIQRPDGSWRAAMQRPPMGGADVTCTVLAMRSLQLYPLRGRAQETQGKIDRAVAWLHEQDPQLHQEQVFQLLGLGWAGVPAEDLTEHVRQLRALQRDDGGWAQLPHLDSDAWATGQSLVALHIAGRVPVTDPAYQRGLQFLLSTQFDDGAWFVKSRSWPFQPPFDSQFPFDHDQWISAPATAWSVMAMTLAVPPGSPATDPRSPEFARPAATDAPEATSSPAASETASSSIDFALDIKPIIVRSCVGCHHGNTPQANFLVTSRASWLQGGDSEKPAITPGYLAESPAVDFMAGKIDGMEMPPLDEREKYPALSARELEVFRTWVRQGAAWPDHVKVEPAGD